MTEYSKYNQERETKKIYRFNENGFLTAKETYDDNEDGIYYTDNDNEGRHLSERITYQFEGNKMVVIEKSEILETLSLDDDEPQTGKLFMETKRFPYVYDTKGRLIAYSVENKQSNKEVTFHLSHLNDNVIQYYFILNENDSVLVYETRIKQTGVQKEVVHTEYQKGTEISVSSFLFQNDTLIHSTSTIKNANDDSTKIVWRYNQHGDPIRYTKLVKTKRGTTFMVVEKDGYKYEYAEDGAQLKEYYTKDFKNYTLIAERNIEFKEGNKIETTRQYNYDGILEFEIIKTYNSTEELISEINKNIFGEYGKLYQQPEVSGQYEYRRIYTFY